MKAIASLVGLITLVAAAGCGGPGSFSGTVSGNALDVQSALYTDAKDSNGNIIGVVVILTDQTDACKTFQAGNESKNTNSFAMQLMEVDSSMSFAKPKVDTYTVINSQPAGGGAYGGALFIHLDSNCNDTLTSPNDSGQSGTIHLDGLTMEKSASGSFDVMMGSQNDHVTGSFNADYCNLDVTKQLNCK